MYRIEPQKAKPLRLETTQNNKHTHEAQYCLCKTL